MHGRCKNRCARRGPLWAIACCLDAVLAGGLRLRSDAFQAAALRALRRVDQPRRARPSLSAQEAGQLECSACGLTQAQTARSLHLGDRTTRWAFSALMERLDAANSRQLMGFGTANAAAS